MSDQCLDIKAFMDVFTYFFSNSSTALVSSSLVLG